MWFEENRKLHLEQGKGRNRNIYKQLQIKSFKPVNKFSIFSGSKFIDLFVRFGRTTTNNKFNNERVDNIFK